MISVCVLMSVSLCVDVDQGSEKQLQQLCGGNRLSIERMLQFGRELQTLSQQLRREFGYNDSNKRAIQVSSLSTVSVCEGDTCLDATVVELPWEGREPPGPVGHVVC